MYDCLTGWVLHVISSVQNPLNPLNNLYISSMQLVPTFLKTVLLFFPFLVLTCCNLCGLSSSWFLLSCWHNVLKLEFLFLQVSLSGSVETRVISGKTDNKPNSKSHLERLVNWLCGCVFSWKKHTSTVQLSYCPCTLNKDNKGHSIHLCVCMSLKKINK